MWPELDLLEERVWRRQAAVAFSISGPLKKIHKQTRRLQRGELDVVRALLPVTIIFIAWKLER